MRHVLASAAVALALAAPAGAATFVLEQTGTSVHGTNGRTAVTITSTSPAVGPIGVSAGGFDVRVKSGSGSTGIAALDSAATFVTWCLDIARALSLPSRYAVTSSPFAADPLTSQQKGDIARLFHTGYDATKLTYNAWSAGFQLALWEIVNETGGSYDVTTGSFVETRATTAAGNARAKANLLLGGLAGQSVNPGMRVIYLESQDARTPTDGIRDSQNFVTYAPVPVPAAGLLLAAALGGLAALRRRRS